MYTYTTLLKFCVKCIHGPLTISNQNGPTLNFPYHVKMYIYSSEGIAIVIREGERELSLMLSKWCMCTLTLIFGL